MPVTMIEPDGGLERWGEYLVTVPESYLTSLDRPCCTPVGERDHTSAVDEGDVAVNAEHLAGHEFAEADDETVARALVEGGPVSKGDAEGEFEESDSDMVGELIRPHLADFELRRRGYSPGQVSRLQSSDWTVLGEGPAR